MDDLIITEYWDKKIQERYPILYNHLLQGGYLNMPSAMMGLEGELGFGYSKVPPYRNYNLRFQLTDQIEVSGNYRIFSGILDPHFGSKGFGELSDKGANIKFAIVHPEDSNYQLPGIAVGLEDFMGTCSFNARYIVATQVFMPLNLEVSLGYGGGRIQGFFGGFHWMPCRLSENPLLQGIALTAEYDATDYKHREKHPKGTKCKTHLNFGFKYRLFDLVDLSAACVRGNSFAWAISTFYNLGCSKGLPKIHDPLPYRSPVNTQPIGILRPEDVLAQDLTFAFEEQGFDVYEIKMTFDECERSILHITIENRVYRNEDQVRCRLINLLGSLIPSNIDKIIVNLEFEGVAVQSYHFEMEFIRAYRNNSIGYYELELLSPTCEAEFRNLFDGIYLFKTQRGLYNFEIFPKTHTLFGSSKGKFKYALGLNFSLNGYLFYDAFYTIQAGWILISNLRDANDVDMLNPSQIINVRSDVLTYYQQMLSLDEAYVQKNWNLGCGWYSKLAFGYFEEEYGGIAAECLYYPVNSRWGFGFDGALVKKRAYTGIGFTDKIRKLEGFKPTYQHFLGKQYFLNYYYNWKEMCLDFKISAGKFLADDYGVKNEISKYFSSGLRVSIWYTLTNGHDKINGKTYHDKGISFSMPLDLFYTHSSRSRWGYGLSAWLRDVGVKAFTGKDLYFLLNENRQEQCPCVKIR